MTKRVGIVRKQLLEIKKSNNWNIKGKPHLGKFNLDTDEERINWMTYLKKLSWMHLRATQVKNMRGQDMEDIVRRHEVYVQLFCILTIFCQLFCQWLRLFHCDCGFVYFFHQPISIWCVCVCVRARTFEA